MIADPDDVRDDEPECDCDCPPGAWHRPDCDQAHWPESMREDDE